MTADAELSGDDELCCEEAVEPLEVEAVEPLEVEAVEPLEVEAVEDPVVAVAPVLPSEPLAAMVPKAIAKVASAAATTRRRMSATRRARARRRSRTRSALGVGGGVEGMRAS